SERGRRARTLRIFRFVRRPFDAAPSFAFAASTAPSTRQRPAAAGSASWARRTTRQPDSKRLTFRKRLVGKALPLSTPVGCLTRRSPTGPDADAFQAACRVCRVKRPTGGSAVSHFSHWV